MNVRDIHGRTLFMNETIFGDFYTLYFTFFCMMYACHEVWEVMDQKVSKKYSQTSLQFLCAKKKRKEKKWP